MSKMIFLRDNTIDYDYYSVAVDNKFKTIHLNFDKDADEYTYGFRVELASESAAIATTLLAQNNKIKKTFKPGDSITYQDYPGIYLGFLDLMGSNNGLVQGVDYKVFGKNFTGCEWWSETGPTFMTLSEDGKYTTHTVIKEKMVIDQLEHAISHRSFIESIDGLIRYESGEYTIIEPVGGFRWEKYMIMKTADFLDPKNFNK